MSYPLLEFLHLITGSQVGTDSTSLALCWTLYLLSLDQTIQSKLRQEILSSPIPRAGEEQDSLHLIESLPYLDKVVKESLRLCPPIHSTIRVASRDEWIRTSPSGVQLRSDPKDVTRHEFKITEGSFIHIPISGLNTDTSVWGSDALVFKWVWFILYSMSFNHSLIINSPDRWDSLPDDARHQVGTTGLFTFLAGPRVRSTVRWT